MSDVANELESLRDADGLLRIERIVEAARDPDSPLHSHFEWNEGKAAHRYRLGQARVLVRAQRIDVRVGPVVVPAAHWVLSAKVVGAYQPLAEVERSSDAARVLILNELSRVGGALGRARNMAAVLGLEDEVDSLLASLAGLKERAAAAPVEPA